MSTPIESQLVWKRIDEAHELPREAVLGVEGDGVRFSVSFYPTCYRRGPYRLLIEVLHGPAHLLWGCLDEDDQPLRNYHNPACVFVEAQAIAEVLWKDRLKTGVPIGSLAARTDAGPKKVRRRGVG